MTVNKYLMPLLAILALFGTIGVAQATGNWVSTGKELVDSQNLTSDDLRGWMTLQQAADGLHLPIETIYQLAGVADRAKIAPDTPLRQLEGTVPGFDVNSLRGAVAAYLTGNGNGKAVEGGQPAPAAAGQEGKTSGSEPASTAAGSAAAAQPKDSGEGASQPPAPGQVLAAKDIKGTMTLREVSEQCGVPLDRVLAAAKIPGNVNPSTQVKSIKDTVPGFEVQALRDAVAGLQK